MADDLGQICALINRNHSVKQYSPECTYLCRQNILVVDDENLNLVVLYSLLSSFGLKPIVCNSGAQAVGIFKQKLQATCCANKFDLVLTDLQMPDTDGLMVAREIRATE
jgi:CheY-like chemotaxis protein